MRSTNFNEVLLQKFNKVHGAGGKFASGAGAGGAAPAGDSGGATLSDLGKIDGSKASGISYAGKPSAPKSEGKVSTYRRKVTVETKDGRKFSGTEYGMTDAKGKVHTPTHVIVTVNGDATTIRPIAAGKAHVQAQMSKFKAGTKERNALISHNVSPMM